jgi:predicted aspartyl protease
MEQLLIARIARIVRRAWIGVALVDVTLSLAACNIGAPSHVQFPADSSAGETSFTLAGPNGAALVVPVYINGRGPYHLILDTGATFTCVDTSVSQELGLPEKRGVLAFGVSVGGSGRMHLAETDSLRVGNALVTDLPICTLDLQSMRILGAQGLLGLNFLKSFQLNIDFERRILRLQKPHRA